MSISKTRQTLVDVARQLFAKNGVANTTMNDIAQASGKGRRTLYTYFNRKEDVYNAVIESELERLSDKLDEVAAKKIRPQDKIIEGFTGQTCRQTGLHHERKAYGTKEKRHQPYIGQSTDHEAADTRYNRKTPHGRRYDTKLQASA